MELNGIEEAGIDYSNYWDGMCEIYLPIHQLPTENEKLYEMFPQLKEKVTEEKENDRDIENDILYVAIYLVDNPTPEETMKLLLPEGQEISFEGMGISKSRSIDGEAHEINSFEEYQQYLKPIENPVDKSDIHPYFK